MQLRVSLYSQGSSALFPNRSISPVSVLEVQIPGQVIPINQQLYRGDLTIYTAEDMTSLFMSEMAAAMSDVGEQNTLFTCPHIIISLKQINKATQSTIDRNTEALAYYHNDYYSSLIWGPIFTSL